jgi:hypothetical protein
VDARVARLVAQLDELRSNRPQIRRENTKAYRRMVLAVDANLPALLVRVPTASTTCAQVAVLEPAEQRRRR